MSVYEINELCDFQKVLEMPNLIVLKVYANWCSPCQSYKSQFENFVANFHEGEVVFIEADVAKNFVKVESLPSTVFIKNKQIIDKIVGIDMNALRQKTIEYSCDRY